MRKIIDSTSSSEDLQNSIVKATGAGRGEELNIPHPAGLTAGCLVVDLLLMHRPSVQPRTKSTFSKCPHRRPREASKHVTH